MDRLFLIGRRVPVVHQREVYPDPVANRSSCRFQSNHQRGYFWRKTIISSGGKNSNPVPPIAIVVVFPVPFAQLAV